MFAKELERRKMLKESALEGSETVRASSSPPSEAPRQASPPAQPAESSATPQLDKSRALSSEGLEGLIPRASLLVRLGGTFFLGFLPLIAIVGILFGGLYLVCTPYLAIQAKRELPSKV
jgi:hypothetical protein